jgi:hypothetical protein
MTGGPKLDGGESTAGSGRGRAGFAPYGRTGGGEGQRAGPVGRIRTPLVSPVSPVRPERRDEPRARAPLRPWPRNAGSATDRERAG